MTGREIRYPLTGIAELAILHRDTLGHVLTPHYIEEPTGVRSLSRLDCSCGASLDCASQ